ncbi:MAG TPA: hypothetical protein VLV89_06470 [Candidatus Acidoferrum sp.]|nr:hypothetical protein [Candidatus Acidoferrum sp.]
MARKLATQLDPKQSLHIEVRDLSGEISSADLASIQNLLESELRTHGIRIAGPGAADIVLTGTISRNFQGMLLIGEFLSDGKSVVAIVPFVNSSPGLPASTSKPMRLQAQLIFDRADPILDFAIVERKGEAATSIVVLGTSDIALYNFSEGQWKLKSRREITRARPISRDVRGRVTTVDAKFFVEFDGASCQGMTMDFDNSSCDPVKDAVTWFHWGPGELRIPVPHIGRNWFDLQLPHLEVYSLAGFESGGEDWWIATGTDSKLHVFRNAPNSIPLAIAFNWGSDVATLRSDCGSHWQVIATGNHDYTESDTLTGFEWTGSMISQVSEPLKIDGPIVALWADREAGPARAVVRDLRNGNYGAYIINVACSH